eukprot:s2775_g4.t1
MKRSVPATPFRVIDGSHIFDVSSSSGSPEQINMQPSKAAPAQGQAGTMVPASAAVAAPSAAPSSMETASHAASSTLQRFGRLSRTEQGGSVGSGSQPLLNQHNAQYVQHNMQQNNVAMHAVHNTIDPQRLEELVGSLVQARAEFIARQMKDQMEGQMQQVQLDYALRLSQAQEERDAKVQQIQAEGQLAVAQTRQSLEPLEQEYAGIKQHAEEQVLQAKQALEKERDSLRQQAEGHVAHTTSQAEGKVRALADANQQLVAERDRLQLAAQAADQKLHPLRDEVFKMQQAAVSAAQNMSRAGSVSESPLGNPFSSPPPKLPVCPTNPASLAGSVASASAGPFETVYCPCCGNQNVYSWKTFMCWKCSTMFDSRIANNGADVSSVISGSFCVGHAPPISAVPSSFIGPQVPVQSAFIAAPAQGCESIPAGRAFVVSGGAKTVSCAGPAIWNPSTVPVFQFGPNGPSIQQGHIGRVSRVGKAVQCQLLLMVVKVVCRRRSQIRSLCRALSSTEYILHPQQRPVNLAANKHLCHNLLHQMADG